MNTVEAAKTWFIGFGFLLRDKFLELAFYVCGGCQTCILSGWKTSELVVALRQVQYSALNFLYIDGRYDRSEQL